MKLFKEYVGTVIGPSAGHVAPVADLGDIPPGNPIYPMYSQKERELTKSDIDQVERYADKLFGALKIDVEFTKHFMDRVNDARNVKQITTSELVRLFKQSYKKYGKKIAKMSDDANAVINDMKTDINMPFVLNHKKGEIELVAKTVMRKKNFTTPASSPKLSFEEFIGEKRDAGYPDDSEKIGKKHYIIYKDRRDWYGFEVDKDGNQIGDAIFDSKKGELKKMILRFQEEVEEAPRIPRKKGQPAGSDKHSDLYTDENPRGTIHGLGFKDVATAKASVNKIEGSGKSHAHKIQAAIAMEQRAKVMGKKAEAAVYRAYIEKMKKKTKKMNEKAPDTSDAMKRYKAGKAGFTDIAHLKAKGLIKRSDGTKRKSAKYEDVRKMPGGGYGVFADVFKDGKRVMTPGGKHKKELKKVYKNEKDANDYMAAIMIAKGGG